MLPFLLSLGLPALASTGALGATLGGMSGAALAGMGAGLGSSASLSAALAGVILLDSGRISEAVDGDGSFASHERAIIRDLAR